MRLSLPGITSVFTSMTLTLKRWPDGVFDLALCWRRGTLEDDWFFFAEEVGLLGENDGGGENVVGPHWSFLRAEAARFESPWRVLRDIRVS